MNYSSYKISTRQHTLRNLNLRVEDLDNGIVIDRDVEILLELTEGGNSL